MGTNGISNLGRALNFSSISELANYSQKTVRALPDLDDLIDQQDRGLFFSSVARLLSVNQRKVAEVYNRYLGAFESFEQEYQILFRKDLGYPTNLARTPGPPWFLFCQGDPRLFDFKGIAVVGSRKASELGAMRAQKLAMLLVANGYVVVSGLAEGIDTAAHRGAISAGGKTIAVIGTPLDKVYPRMNDALQKAIAQRHLLVSQFPFGHPVRKFNFPNRNYTMSGISYATVIVEASETSGALIQARQCMAQGRHLFILKNLLQRSELKWPHRFVERGAYVVQRIEDVPEHLGLLPDYRLDNDIIQHSMLF